MRNIIDRPHLKSRAKAVLKKYYWVLLVVSVIIAATSGGNGFEVQSIAQLPVPAVHITNNTGNITDLDLTGLPPAAANIVNNFANQPMVNINEIMNVSVNPNISPWMNFNPSGIMGTIPFVGNAVNLGALPFLILFGIGLAFALVVMAMGAAIFIAYPFKVGAQKIFINTADAHTKPDFKDLLHSFTCGKYLNIVLAGFLTSLYTILWSMLFVIPGIVKSYAYRMVPYIMADNPHMRAGDAIALSVEMTRGHKWDMFILDLSFIGWHLLGSLAFGIGVIFVNPYVDATMAQLYITLRDNAIRTRIAEPANFGMGFFDPDAVKHSAPASPNDNGPAPGPAKPGDDVIDYRDKPFDGN